jgi:VanZ family protein
MHPFIRYWLPVIGYCALIFVQSSFPSYEHLPSFKSSDKLLHVAAYALLAALFCRAFSSSDRWHRRRGALFILSVAATTAYGLSDEWHQSFVAGRSAEVADAAADFAGSLIGGWLYLQCFGVKKRSGTS